LLPFAWLSPNVAMPSWFSGANSSAFDVTHQDMDLSIGTRARRVTLAAASTGLALGFMLVSIYVDAISGAEASNIGVASPDSIQLAQAFTAALNAHDEDGLVGLFTEDDAGPTITADRFAWQKFEIRLWAQQQIQANIRTEGFDYRVTERGAAWNADVYRDDWRAVGITAQRVTNSIWVHNGQLADFTSKLTEPGDHHQLGRLWQPGTAPERPTSIARPKWTSTSV
jgi:hypothetical protein